MVLICTFVSRQATDAPNQVGIHDHKDLDDIVLETTQWAKKALFVNETGTPLPKKNSQTCHGDMMPQVDWAARLDVSGSLLSIHAKRPSSS